MLTPLTNDLDLDIDLDQVLGQRVDLDETRVYSSGEATKLRHEADITLRDLFHRVSIPGLQVVELRY